MTTTNHNDSFTVDLMELQRVVRVQQVLAAPAEFYQDHMSRCQGDCMVPKVLVEKNDREITCCAFKIVHDLVVDAERLEKHVRKRIAMSTHIARTSSLADSQRRKAVDGLMLKQALPRDFTGTYVGRRSALFEEEQEAEPVIHKRPSFTSFKKED